MTSADDVYLIVVVGAMNPAIHHPGWYEATKILSAEEARDASRTGVVVVSPQVAQFNSGHFAITCDPVRWQIQTTEASEVRKAVDVAEKTFEVLFQTPISAFGFNFLHHRSVHISDVPNVLGGLLRRLPLGLLSDNAERQAGKLTYERVSGHRVIRTAIEPSMRGADRVYVAINVEHRIEPPPPGTYKQFQLKLVDAFLEDEKDATRQLASTLQALEGLNKGAPSHNGA